MELKQLIEELQNLIDSGEVAAHTDVYFEKDSYDGNNRDTHDIKHVQVDEYKTVIFSGDGKLEFSSRMEGKY